MPVLRLVLMLLSLGWAMAAGPALALDPATTGVVVMHGKWGDNGNVRPVAEALRQAGFLVETPTMPWAGNRMYDRRFDQAADEIDAVVAKLAAQGAQRIVIAGHSLGGAAAFHYAGLGRPTVVAAVLIAPAPVLENPKRQDKQADSVERARAMVAAGEGNDTGSFLDINSGDRTRTLPFPAAVYLSYCDPQGPAAMSHAAAAVGALPVLWIAPSTDPNTEWFATYVVPALPAGNHFERADVSADHMGAVMAGRDKVVAWLRALPPM